MTAIYKARKNSNVSEYVKARVLYNNIEFLLENGVSDLLNELSDPLHPDEIVIWGSGSIEISIYSSFYLNNSNNNSIFKKSISGREELRGFKKSGSYYIENKSVFDSIQKVVTNISETTKKSLNGKYFGYVLKNSIKLYNGEDFYFFGGEAYVSIKDINNIPEKTLPDLQPMKLSEFFLLYEKESDLISL